MSPGNVSETEAIMAAPARQFCKRHKGQDRYTSTFRKAHNSTCIPIPSMRPIHRGNVYMSAMYEPILSESRNKIRQSFDNDKKKGIVMTYVGDHDSGYRGQENGVATYER